MDEETRYEAVCSRDSRFDGHFFFAVTTTGVYCRPSCPAVAPKRRNVRFYPTAAAAQGSGFRACRRCRPDAVPGSAEWNVRADLVGRAMRFISDGVVDREGVAGLAGRLGYSTRQVQRQLTAELGAGPVALARAQRAHTARILLRTTALPVTEIAFAAGFASVRQFNDTIRAVYADNPTGLRRGARGRPTGPAAVPTGTEVPAGGAHPGITLRLAHRGPYAAREMFDFLARRAVPGVEEVRGEPGGRLYRRTLDLPRGHGVAEVHERAGTGAAPGARARHGSAAPSSAAGWLDCRLRLGDLRDLTTAVQRLRRLFDLDADPSAVSERLAADPRFAPLVARRPGLRSPGAVDPHEAAVRAVLARHAGPGAAGALVVAYGTPLVAPDGALTHLFPGVGTLAAAAPLDAVDLPDAARRTLSALAGALADGRVVLDPGADRDRAERELLALPGIDARTAAGIRMRALSDPDVDLPADEPVSDPGAPARPAGPDTPARDALRPWRSYAHHHLRLHRAGETTTPETTAP